MTENDFKRLTKTNRVGYADECDLGPRLGYIERTDLR